MTIDAPNTVSNPTETSSKIAINFREKKIINSWLRKLLFLCLFAGIGLTALRIFELAPGKNAKIQLPTQAVERQNLSITVTANGKIEAERSINVSPKNAGIVKNLLVKEGDAVKKGQIIAYMDDSNLQGQLTQAKAGIASSEANLQKLLAGNRAEDIAQSQAQLEEAQANLNKLLAGNRPQDVAQVQARLRQREAELQQVVNDSPQEITLAQMEVKSAEARLQLVGSRLKSNQMLLTEGAIASDKFNEVETEYKTNQLNLEQAKQKLEKLRTSFPSRNFSTGS
jgi:HlyD family secretion protein